MSGRKKAKMEKAARRLGVGSGGRWRDDSDRWDAFRGRNFPGYVPLYGEYTPITVRSGTVVRDEFLKDGTNGAPGKGGDSGGKRPESKKSRRERGSDQGERWRDDSDPWDSLRGRRFPGYVPLYGDYTPITVRTGTVMKDEFLKRD